MSVMLTSKLLSMGGSLYFHCPGCDCLHPYRVRGESSGPIWQYNGNHECPTFTPSLLVWGSRPENRCHLFITDGKIQYCGDCHHALAGTTVDMVDIPDPQFWVGEDDA